MWLNQLTKVSAPRKKRESFEELCSEAEAREGSSFQRSLNVTAISVVTTDEAKGHTQHFQENESNPELTDLGNKVTRSRRFQNENLMLELKKLEDVTADKILDQSEEDRKSI